MFEIKFTSNTKFNTNNALNDEFVCSLNKDDTINDSDSDNEVEIAVVNLDRDTLNISNDDQLKCTIKDEASNLLQDMNYNDKK